MSADRGWLLAGGTAFFLGLIQTASAQPIPDKLRTQSVLNLPRPGYQPRNIVLGNVVLAPQLDASAIYDDNIFAAHTARRDDVVFSVQPSLTAKQSTGRFQWNAAAFGEIRRYASQHSENSESYGLTADATYTLSSRVGVSAGAGFRRLVENRADPELRQGSTQGPPLFDVLNGQLQLRVSGNKFGISFKGELERYDFNASIADDRDFTSYRGTLRVSYRFAPAVSAFGQAYVNQRDFRVRDRFSGVNRDARTLGGLAGVQFDPGGKFRGDIGAGIFHFDPADPSLKGFSGFALEGSLTYQPRSRTALILDLFSGDVATVRNGASGRIDRRAHLTVQQEVRHNLLASAGIGIRQTRYRGVNEKLTTLRADAEIEYLLSGHFSIGLTGQFARRTAGSISDRFERFRIGAEVKVRY